MEAVAPSVGTSEQQPPRSPSPEQKAPISQEPGPRAQALNNIFTTALSHTTSTCSYAHFSSCFPTAARYNKPLLESVWRQVQNMVESRSRREFEQILLEKDVVKDLNDLDKLIGEAKVRKERAEPALEQPLHEVPPTQLFLAHLAPSLQGATTQLEAELEGLQRENDALIEKMKGQEEEVEALVQGLEAGIKDLGNTNEIMDEAVEDGTIRQEAREIHSEVARRRGETKSRL
ncbi:uncharacterized protein KY384_008272 [Bacidia gigantensis]|uniref:uncharacterized protein n=1 Tax=Bacidia gigantensis TaxID=2732470 RepID=UPI001D047345|nr:uncharacterized protein KY384_008272 [Bacidia gigantensis]KAG8526843.1 hypothetical protein KY384_008272 [Bacidia gigantensis]